MVYEVLIPISGSFLDGLVTTLYTDRYGTKGEGNPIFRKIQERFGTWKSLPIRQVIKTTGIVGLYYLANQVDDGSTKNLSPQELFSYISGAMFYGVTLLNSVQYISRRRSE